MKQHDDDGRDNKILKVFDLSYAPLSSHNNTTHITCIFLLLRCFLLFLSFL